MLKKIGQVSLGLVCLIAVSSFAGAAEGAATAGDTPTIGELSASAEAAAPAEPAAAVEAAAEAVEAVAPKAKSAEDILAEFAAQRKIEKEAKKARAAALVQQAHHEIFIENRPDKGLKLAEEARLLDPENEKAEDLRTEAAAQLGDESAILKEEQNVPVSNLRLRIQAGIQSVNNSIVQSRELYATGEYAEALKELRKASLSVDYLSTFTDVSKQRAQIDAMMARVDKDYESAEHKRAAVRKAEAGVAAKDEIKRITEEKRQEAARAAMDVIELIKDANFEEARLELDDMLLVDPSDRVVPILLEELSEAEHTHVMKKLNAKAERGDLRFEQWTADMMAPPERPLSYPDKKFWKDVVEQRVPMAYPSDRIPLGATALDRQVYEQLTQMVSLPFDQTPLVDVVDFLQETTNISYSLRRQDVPMDGGPVTLSIDTTLENALNQITELTGMAWKVDGGLVKIGSPESMRTYEMRVYNVTDLLLSVEDKFGGTEGLDLDTGSNSSSNNDNNNNDRFWQFGGSSSGYGGGGGGGTGQQQNMTQLTARAENLILMIKQACGAGTWEDPYSSGLINMASGQGMTGPTGGGPRGGGFADPGGSPYAYGGPGGGFGAPGGGFGGPGPGGGQTVEQPQGRAFVMGSDPQNIMVVQTAKVHECIERLLKEMRGAMKIQIQVDVRFLSVSNDFLREVGFDWTHFNLNPDGYDSVGNLDGFGLSSSAYGGFLPWVQPEVGFGFDSNGEIVGFTAAENFGFGHPYGSDGTWDSDTLTYTFTKQALLGTSSFIGTGIPFFGTDTSGLALDVGYAGAIDIAGIFRLGHERNEMKTLSAPTITLTNGQLGYITVGTEITYIDSYEVEDNTLVPETDEVTDGVGLSVRPIASADLKYVFLELAPTVQLTDLTNTATWNTFVGQPGGDEGDSSGALVQNSISLPQVNQETLETTVGVPDRGILMVGGLTTGNFRHQEGGVPILDKIPLVKRLFSAEGRQTSRERLFVLARPQIIILGEEEERMR